MKKLLLFLLLLPTLLLAQVTPPGYPYADPLPTTGTIPVKVTVTQAIAPSAYNDNRPAVWDDFVGGGYQTKGTTTERDGILSNRRKEGMLVYVAADDHIYRLDSDLTSWIDLGAANSGAFGQVDTTIYGVNGTLTGARLMTGAGYPLTFNGLSNFIVTNASGVVAMTAANVNLGGTTATTVGYGTATPVVFPASPSSTIVATDQIMLRDTSGNLKLSSAYTAAQIAAIGTNTVNIYNSNGTLTGNRSLSGGGLSLALTNISILYQQGSSGINAFTTITESATATSEYTAGTGLNLRTTTGELVLNSTTSPWKFPVTPSTSVAGDYVLLRAADGTLRWDASVTKANITSANTLYTGNGSLIGDRTVTGGGYDLTITNIDYMSQTSANSLYYSTGTMYLGGASLVLGSSSGLSLLTPAVSATTAKAGQYLKLTADGGSAEFGAPFYVAYGTQAGSVYEVSNADLVPDYSSSSAHPDGTVVYLKVDAASVGADLLQLGPSTPARFITHHDGTTLLAGEMGVYGAYYVLVYSSTTAKWILQGMSATPAAGSAATTTVTVDTVADLVAFDHTSAKQAVTRGYYAVGDGGNGSYYWLNSVTSTNKGSKIASAVSGSWNLLAEEQNVRQWGAKGDGSTDDAVAINAAITYASTLSIGRSVFIPKGQFRIGAPIYIRGSDLKLRVNGHVKNINGTNTAVLIAGAIYNTGSSTRITNGIVSYETSNVTIDGEGIGILDQNSQNATAWESTNPDAGAWHSLIVHAVDGAQVKNITVTNSIIWSVTVEVSKSVEVSGCRVYNGRHNGRMESGIFRKSTQDGIHLHDCIDSSILGNYVESQDDTFAVSAARTHSQNIVVANNTGRVLTRLYMADGTTLDTNSVAGRMFLSIGINGGSADVSLTNVVASANICTGGQGLFYIFDEDGTVAHTGTTQGIKLIGNSFSGLVDEASGTNTTTIGWLILGAKDVDIVGNSFVNIARRGRILDFESPTPGLIRFADNLFQNWQIPPDSQEGYPGEVESIIWAPDGTSLIIENNTFIDNQISPIWIGESASYSTNAIASVIIRGNTFKNNMQRWSSTPSTYSSVAFVNGANHVTFSDNVLEGNKGHGLTVRSWKTLIANNNKINGLGSGYTDYGNGFRLINSLNDSAMTTTLIGNVIDTIDGYAIQFTNPGFVTVQNNVIRNSNIGYGSDLAMVLNLSGSALSDLPYANFGGVFSGNQVFDATAKVPLYLGSDISTAAYTGSRLAYLDTQGAGASASVTANGAGIIDFSQGYVVVTGNYTLKTYQKYANVTAAAVVTLPDATLCYGKEFTIKRRTTGAVTLATTSSQTFNGGSITHIVGDTVAVKSDGTGWLARAEGISIPAVLPDADFVYFPGASANYYIETTAITADRAVSLHTDGVYEGCKAVFTRNYITANPYFLTVGGLLALNSGDSAEFIYRGGAWRIGVVTRFAVNGVVTYGDVSATYLPYTTERVMVFSSTLTADRTVTLSTTGVFEGASVRVVRSANATGAFNLTINGKVLSAASTWADFTYDSAGGGSWYLTASGSL